MKFASTGIVFLLMISTGCHRSFQDYHEVKDLSGTRKGAAWYQKEVDIPEHWTGKHVKLLLERTKDINIWFEDIHCGYENTLSAYQYFDLSNN